MLILLSPDKGCVICLGRQKRSVYQDLDATIESYKVEAQSWWKLTRTLKNLKELYRNCLNKTNNDLLVWNKISSLMLIASYGHIHKERDGQERK